MTECVFLEWNVGSTLGFGGSSIPGHVRSNISRKDCRRVWNVFARREQRNRNRMVGVIEREAF